jgi:glutathione S-transferase
METTENGKKIVLSQSLAIARFLANRFGLAGKNEHDKALVEMYAEQTRDLQEAFIKIRSENDEKKKGEMFNEHLSKNLSFFESRLAKNGTGYLVGDSLTWVDLYVYFVVTWVENPQVKDALNNAPNVQKLIKKVTSNVGIAAYLKSRPVTDF